MKFALKLNYVILVYFFGADYRSEICFAISPKLSEEQAHLE